MATGVPGSRGGENPEFVLREFGGINLQASREIIGENEFYWLENIVPIASGNLTPTQDASSALVTIAETGAPTYTTPFNVNGVDYTFAVWSNSGNGWIVNMSTFVATQIGTALWTSGQTSATQWSNLGLLIIDPAGYWDWNVTTANTLTSLSNGVLSTTLVSRTGFPGGTSIFAGYAGTGTGVVGYASFSVIFASVTAAGTGYFVGDVLTVLSTGGAPGGGQVTACQVTVTTIGGGGTITGISISNVGVYKGPNLGTFFTVGPTGVVCPGGFGTGAQISVDLQLTGWTITYPGTGVSSTDTLNDAKHLGVGTYDTTGVTPSGLINGTAIAVYAGRVWIANNRTVSFTDAGYYSSFGGTGSAFTITDAYLHNSITALYPANNYLYIWGDDSIDALSNVTVSAGVASFSRINIISSIGTHLPTSIFPYYRGLAFANTTGFWLLSGATPEKMSDKLAQLVSQINFANLVYGGEVVVQNELCAAFLFTFTDIFTTTTPAARTIFAIFFRGRWWLASMSSLVLSGAVSIPVGGVQTLFAWAGPTLYQCFTGSVVSWLLKTRLWDAGAPLKEKQAINAAIGLNLNGLATSGLSLYIDTEYKSLQAPFGGSFPLVTWVNQANQPVTWVNSLNAPVAWEGAILGYDLLYGSVQAGGSQYLGMTLSGGSDVSRVRLLAMLGKQDRNMLK
jgi:hypothetical protein